MKVLLAENGSYNIYEDISMGIYLVEPKELIGNYSDIPGNISIKEKPLFPLAAVLKYDYNVVNGKRLDEIAKQYSKKDGFGMNYKEFRNGQVELQLIWRKKQNNLSKELGKQNGNEHAHIVPKDEWIKTVWDKYSNDLLLYLQKEKIQHHTGSHNLLSSWVLCSNLYFVTIINNDFKELFKQFLENKLQIKIEKINKIHLELVLPEELSPIILLGEHGGIRGTRQTTPDFAIEFTSYGKENILLVECKYTEHSFYDCPLRSNELCKNIEILYKNCIQKDKLKRKYWDYLSITEYGIKILKCCPAYTGGYQIFRQQALAEGILKSGNYENVWSCIAYDGRNEGLMRSMEKIGIKSIKNEWEKLFKLKTKFSIWEHQEWVNFVRENGNESLTKEWFEYIENRYKI